MPIDLNDAQQQAVDHRGTPLLVLAGAGSGKTRVLTTRIAGLIGDGVAPERVLAVTFTNKAAAEMRRRVAGLLGRDPTGMWIGTFHSLAARLLRREAHHLGFSRNFSIYDEEDMRSLVRRVLVAQNYTPKEYPPAAVNRLISHAKNRMQTPEQLASEAFDPIEEIAAELMPLVERELHDANAMDFDNLLLHPLRLFGRFPDRLDWYRQRFEALLVDEFQDTNRPQYLFVKSLTTERTALCAVGDDDQSIYGWRGADVRHMLDFHRDFPRVEVIRLEENYRSTERILDVANLVISANTERLGKTLRTARGIGDRVTSYAAADERDEAEWIAGEIEEWAVRTGSSFHSGAVLYRTNAQSRAFEDAFRRRDIPYRVVGAASFYDRREVKDVLAYLRLVANPNDQEAFVRASQVPKRGVGPSTIAAVRAEAERRETTLCAIAELADELTTIRPAARKALSAFGRLITELREEHVEDEPADLIMRLLAALNYEDYLLRSDPDGADRLENVRELVASAADWSELRLIDLENEGATALELYLAHAALITAEQKVSGDAGVTLMTVHTAKGLEWPLVVVAGLEDGLFPLARADERPGGVEEERRLCYVAVTRAQDRLYLTWARTRRRGGEIRPGRASRFLRDLDGRLDERRSRAWWSAPAWDADLPAWQEEPTVALDDVDETSQLAPRYVRGERVRHRRFGSGTISAVEKSGRDLKVLVDFDDPETGSKHLLARFARLEREVEGV